MSAAAPAAPKSAPTVEQLQDQLASIINLIESDHYASAFQSLGQYRKALNDFISEVTK